MLMEFVSEKIIDQIVAQFEENANYDIEFEILQKKQPVIAAYLVSKNFDVLTKDEKEYLIYLALVIVKSADTTNKELPLVSEERLGEAEEKNYGIMATSKERSFRDKLNVFFNNYQQEDLLAFAEDALVIDDEAKDEFFQVTKEGREPIFLALKSIIDALN